ncbi:MAG: FAD-dependent oxidoreductase [Pseudomonadota bacterium]
MHIAVVGKGLIGSAAARHLAGMGHRVTLIGPDEPETPATHAGVFASHYDEGRITRWLDAHPFWAEVSKASIDRYAEVEAVSGVKVFSEVGAVLAGEEAGDFMARVSAVRDRLGILSDALRGEDLAARLPFFHFDDGYLAYHESSGSGHISPRRMVAAQTIAAEKAGAVVIRAKVLGIDAGRIETEGGPVDADEVLVAAGGYSDSLLRGSLGLKVMARTAAFFRLGPAEAARLARMPSLVSELPDGRDPYILPPIRYPDGATYLKIGGDPVDRELTGADAISDWFRSGGNGEVAEGLRDHLRDRMPGLDYEATHHVACVTTFTPDNLPKIARLDDRLSVATAGCGRGAKCSDELGRLGALCALGYDSELAAHCA